VAISERLALLVTLDARGAVKGFNDLGKAADKNLGKADQKLDRMASRFQKAGAGMLATAGLAAAGLYKAGQSAADLEQAVGGTEAVFGDASKAIDDYASKAARAAGLSESAFRTATTSIGGQLKGLGFTTRDAADEAVKLTQVAADLSATYGGTTAEAVAALGAAFRGEADPAERFNLFLNQTRVNAKAVELGLAASTSQVDAQAKAQAVLALVTEQSADAQGQFAREAGTAAGQMAIASAEIENAKASLGQAVAPVIADVAGGLADLAGGFQAANVATGGFISRFAAIGATGLAVGGGLSFTVGKLIDMRDTLAPLGGRLRSAEGGLTRLGKAGAALGAAGAIAGLVAMGREADNAQVDIAELETRLANLNDTNRESLRELIVSAEAFGNLDSVVRQAADSSVPLAERLIEQADAMGLSKERTAELTAIVDEKRDADVQAASDQAEYTASVETATGAVGGFTEEVDANKEALDAATESANLFKQGLDDAFGDLSLEEAADRRAAAFEDMASRFEDAQQNVKDAKQRVADLQAVAPEDRSDSWARDLAAAQAEVREAIEETSRTLVGNSEVALQNREDLRGAVEDIGAVIQAHRDEGASLEDLQIIREMEKQNLVSQLEQLGFNREEIGRYIEAIDAIPITKETTVTVETARAEARLKEAVGNWQKYLDQNPLSIDVAQTEKFANGPRSLPGGSYTPGATRAIGGPVSARSSYLVGEYGVPELFTPATNGTITPLASMSSAVGSQVNHIIINNPTPEPASTSIRKVRSELAA
jgi:hypothetical protein